MEVLDKKVLTARVDGCKRPRRVYDILCQYLDVPHRGEILLEMEEYIADDLRELADNEEKFDRETRCVAVEIADLIEEKAADYDYLWITY